MNRPINIVLVSLNDKFCKSVGQNLAESLDMLSANCSEMIVYDLINPKEVIEKCGLEYFKKRESGVVRNCSEYENIVLSIDYNLFKTYSHFFEQSLVVYIRLPHGKQDKVPNEIDFEVRDEFLKTNCNIQVDVEQKFVKKCSALVLKMMGEYYEDCE